MMYLTIEDTYQLLDKIPSGNLAEFGVFSGNTMNRLINGAANAKNPFIEVYGFDSFIGLPKENPNVWNNPEWPEGAFSLCKDFNLNSIEEALTFVKNNVERKDINLIPGFFKESLTEEIGRKLSNTCSYLHIDVDIYTSSKQVLNFIFDYKIAKPFSIFRFDDWNSTPEYQGGNSLAYLEICRKHRPIFHRISNNVFQLMEY